MLCALVWQAMWPRMPPGSGLTVVTGASHTSFLDAGFLLNSVFDALCCRGRRSRRVRHILEIGNTQGGKRDDGYQHIVFDIWVAFFKRGICLLSMKCVLILYWNHHVY
jgi:hypothetical protein